MDYFENNLLVRYKIRVIICSILIVLSSIGTIWCMYKYDKAFNKTLNNAFVFYKNGASIHVFNNVPWV